MSDVIQLAKERRDKLCAEFEQLEAFIKMGETLISEQGDGATVTMLPSAEDQSPPAPNAAQTSGRMFLGKKINS